MMWRLNLLVFSLLLTTAFFCGCKKKLKCENNTVEVCVVNTRSNTLIGSLRGSALVDTLSTNQRKCYTFLSTDIFTFETNTGKKYTWNISSCEDDYPVF
jgi:hypothetical protein